MEKMKEEWRAINGYEGLYEVSNMGRVKSLAKSWIAGNGGVHSKKDTILKSGDCRGYRTVVLCNEGHHKTIKVHLLVYDHFGKGKRNGMIKTIDHINNIKSDNRIANLQLLTSRENLSKGFMNKKKTSQYTGVYWSKQAKKWHASIANNKITNHLGYFTNELDASNAYQNALGLLNE